MSSDGTIAGVAEQVAASLAHGELAREREASELAADWTVYLAALFAALAQARQQYLDTRRDAAAKGGRRSAEARRSKLGTAQPGRVRSAEA